MTDTLTSKEISDYIHRSYDGYGVVPLDYSILLIGGTFASRPVKDVYVYNFHTSKSWAKTSPLNLGRSSAAVVTLPISYTGKAINTLGLGSISGLITRNGIPVAGKKIMLTSPPDGYTVSSTTSTDKNGKYTFVALQPGLYRIGVEQEDNSNGYSIPTYKGKQEVQLEKGEKITDYNFDTTKPF